jgi:hypothetical protein
MKKIVTVLIIFFVQLRAAEGERPNSPYSPSDDWVIIDSETRAKSLSLGNDDTAQQMRQRRPGPKFFVGEDDQSLNSLSGSPEPVYHQDDESQSIIPGRAPVRSSSGDSLVDMCVDFEALTKTAICSVAQKAETAYWFLVTWLEDLPQD